MKKFLAVFLALLCVFSLCACGSASKKAMGSTEATMYEEPAPEEAPGAANGYGGFAASETYDMTAAADASESDSADAEGTDTPAVNPAKIIYSANATVETTAFDETLEKLSELVKGYGGYIESSSINGANYYNNARGYISNRSADYTLRVPSEKFAEIMTKLSDLGNVPYSNTYQENISSRYYDTSARLTALKTQETRLLEMMEKAETVSDIITIEDRLTELRYQIESLQSTLNSWDREVSYSTLTLFVQEVSEYTPETQKALTYGQELWLALKGGLRDAGEFFKDLLVFLVSALPVLIILAVLAIIFVPVVKKNRAKRRALKQAKYDAANPDTDKK